MSEVTLKSLREESEKSLGEIVREFRDVAPEVAPKERSGVIHWEKQGITDVRVIRGLSRVYDKPFEEVERAALESRARYIERKAKQEKSHHKSNYSLDTVLLK